MSKINVGKVLMGGVAAGAVLAACDFAINNFILADAWQRVLQARNVDAAASGGNGEQDIACCEAGIAAFDDRGNRRARVGDDVRGALADRNLFEQNRRRNQRPDLGNPEIIGTFEHEF